MALAYQTFQFTGALTAEQIEFFNTNGFIHFKQFFNKNAIDAIIKASKEVEAEWLAKRIQKINGVPIKYGTDLDGSQIVQRFAFINKHHPVLEELSLDPRLQHLLPLVGEGARFGTEEKDGMVLNHYVNGPQSKFTQMGWHTDGLRDVFQGTKLNPMLNVGIHLSTLREENGGLRILPGTHKQSLYQLLFRKKYFISHDTDPQELAILPEAGDLTIHDGKLWHRVAKSHIVGETSRRRVIYVPIIAGKFAPKNENSPTLFYQRFAGLVK